MQRAELRHELLEALETAGVRLPTNFGDDTSLIRSGLLDSAALFELALWVESRVPPGLDVTAFDLAEMWDTVEKVLAFVQHHERAPS